MAKKYKSKTKRLTEKQFEDSLIKLRAKMQQDIAARCDGFDTSPEATAKRRERARHDREFFARTYFPHYIRGKKDPETGEEKPIPLSVFQADFIKRLGEGELDPEGVNDATAAPRGEAKSTYLTIDVIHDIVYELKHYIIYAMDIWDQAASVVESIKVELEGNPRLLNDFPDATGQGPVWQVGVIVTKNSRKIQARGAGQRLRGLKHYARRPDKVVLDDIENDENVKQPKQRDKLEDWLDQAVENLGEAGEKCDIWLIGTVLHYDAVLVRKMNNPMWTSRKYQAIIQMPTRMDLWEKWEEILQNEGKKAARKFYKKHRAKMHEGAIVSWPTKRDILYLMEKRFKIKSRAFNTEYQNTATDENASFQTFTYWVQTQPEWQYFGACDPSLGKKGKGRDPSAILVGGFNRKAKEMCVLEASIRKRTPKVIINNILAFQKQYGCVAWAIESVQFQELLRTDLIDAAIDNHININAVPIQQSIDKDLRIETLSVPIVDERIKFHSSQRMLISQLEQWPNGDHDDGPDCLQMLWDIAITYTKPTDIRTAGDRAASTVQAMTGQASGPVSIHISGSVGAVASALNLRDF